MPYRRSGETLEVRTASGAHEIITTVDGLEVRGPHDTHLVVTRTIAFTQSRDRREQFAITGPVVVADNGPRDEAALWISTGPTTMRRIFCLASASAAPLMRRALRRHSPTIISAMEVGGARHRMLLVEQTDRHALFAARLFREQADLALTLFHDGRIEPDAKLELTVQGHDVRFIVTNQEGVARFAFPWLAPAERVALARRLTRMLAMQDDVVRLRA